MIDISEAVTRAALTRTESRGGHAREDFPETDKEWGRKNLVIRKDGGGLRVVEEPLIEMPDELKAIVAKAD
jgi:succinate dehydrogenase / fumarate reductase, flavoprotein subunit